MPLPGPGHQISGYQANNFESVTWTNLPITPIGTFAIEFKARRGNAAWNGNILQMSAPDNSGPANYYFVPDKASGISGAIVYCMGAGEFYVASDQFGGCEWHVLYNRGANAFAFMHVYKGPDAVIQYNLAVGWERRGVRKSLSVAQDAKSEKAQDIHFQPSIISMSCIQSGNNPTINTKFMTLQRGANAPPTVRVVHDGLESSYVADATTLHTKSGAD